MGLRGSAPLLLPARSGAEATQDPQAGLPLSFLLCFCKRWLDTHKRNALDGDGSLGAVLLRCGGRRACGRWDCVMATGGHHLPSTVTWQEHSAWPAPFLATHLYRPLSSGSAFSMETEQREPGEEEEERLSGPGMGPIPALEPGAQEASVIHMGSLREPEVRGPGEPTPSSSKARALSNSDPK